MKRRVIAALTLTGFLVGVAWIVQFHYGIGSCGPASDTPLFDAARGQDVDPWVISELSNYR